MAKRLLILLIVIITTTVISVVALYNVNASPLLGWLLIGVGSYLAVNAIRHETGIT